MASRCLLIYFLAVLLASVQARPTLPPVPPSVPPRPKWANFPPMPDSLLEPSPMTMGWVKRPATTGKETQILPSDPTYQSSTPPGSQDYTHTPPREDLAPTPPRQGDYYTRTPPPTEDLAPTPPREGDYHTRTPTPPEDYQPHAGYSADRAGPYNTGGSRETWKPRRRYQPYPPRRSDLGGPKYGEENPNPYGRPGPYTPPRNPDGSYVPSRSEYSSYTPPRNQDGPYTPPWGT